MAAVTRASGGEAVLLLATRNAGKVAEIQELLAGSGWRVRPLPAEIPEYEETGDTFADNARGKALHYAALTGLPALADDSGLQIDALGGKPGVRSARWIDPDIPQSKRNEEALRLLRGLPEERRSARFVCRLALAHRGTIVHETRGVCEGRIAESARGEGGFGYDPIFLHPPTGRTFAESSREEKSRLSHRGQAVRAMAEFLRRWRPQEAAD